MSDNLSYLDEVYSVIKNQRKKYGELKKCEFHLHTPASYDYRLSKDKNYKLLIEEEILELAVEIGYLSEEARIHILSKIDEYKSDDYVHKELESKKKPFVNFKEYFSYLLIAHKLYQSGIEVAIISDHNTIKGYQKLKYALNEYYISRIKSMDKANTIHLFLGVEISCSEQNHLIAIFDDKEEERVEAFLEKFIMKEDGGTYLSCQNVIETLRDENIKALTYIAHLNTSNFYVYNKFLFSKDNFDVFGLTQLSSKEKIYDRLTVYNKDSKNLFGIIHEGDAHSLEEIGLRNTWIKFNHINYRSMKRAFNNFSINVYPEKPTKSNKFINGLIIHSGEEGFLGKEDLSHDNQFLVDFSRDLNCIIGGRGTGKSTLLNMIECAFSLEIDDMDKLKVVSRHEKMHIVFTLNNIEYILEFVPQVKNLEKEYYVDNIFVDKALIQDEESGKIMLSPKWISLFKMEGSNWIRISVSQTRKIINEFYNRSYSINRIINDIDHGKIGDLVKSTIVKQEATINLKAFHTRVSSKRESLSTIILNDLKILQKRFDKRNINISQSLALFNGENKLVLEIVQSPNSNKPDTFIRHLLDSISSEKEVENFNMTYDNLANYIFDYVKKYNYIDFLIDLFSNKYSKINGRLNLLNYSNGRNNLIGFNQKDAITQVEKELKQLTIEDIPFIFQLLKDILSVNYKREVLESITSWFEVFDEYTLKFNINKKESSKQELPLMKDIEEMSLGQRVAAILSFIFNYGKFTNDSSPLIIDQPEDNLDNQYIYKNLVESLKHIKNNRQVIIVTHNSTIVTNAETEQVVVLNSNNKNGWVEKLGYPTDPKVTKLILNYLEGGIDSFKHKMESYSNILNDLN